MLKLALTQLKATNMKYLEIFDKDGKALHIADVMRSAYFDIPNSEMTYATYSTKAYFDEQGWFLIDCDGKKQYEDEKWLRVSSHCA
jgi:hypothetical protein